VRSCLETIDTWLLYKPHKRGACMRTDFHKTPSRTGIAQSPKPWIGMTSYWAFVLRFPGRALPQIDCVEFACWASAQRLPETDRGFRSSPRSGDSHAALVGTWFCTSPGTVKATYGTGFFVDDAGRRGLTGEQEESLARDDRLVGGRGKVQFCSRRANIPMSGAAVPMGWAKFLGDCSIRPEDAGCAWQRRCRMRQGPRP
jgi:hypothetical protein